MKDWQEIATSVNESAAAEVVLTVVADGSENAIELVDSMVADDLPRYTVRSIINRKFKIELFDTLADAEVYVEELKTIMAAVARKKFRSFSADFNPATLDN